MGDIPSRQAAVVFANLADVPSLWNVGSDGTEIPEDEAFELVAERDPGIVRRWEEIEARYPGYDEQVVYHSVRQHLGIRSFGAAAWTAPAGQCLVPPHSETEAGYDQEELYVVIGGRARFVCDGEAITLEPGQVLYIAPQVFREAVALSTPTTVLVVGGTPGRAYAPPPFALDWPTR